MSAPETRWWNNACFRGFSVDLGVQGGGHNATDTYTRWRMQEMRCGNEATLLLTPSKTQQNKRGHCSAIPPVGAGLPIPPHEPKNQRDGDEIPRGNHHADTGGTPTHLLHGLHAIAVEENRAVLLCDRHGAHRPPVSPRANREPSVCLGLCTRSDATPPPDCRLQTGPERKGRSALTRLFVPPRSSLSSPRSLPALSAPLKTPYRGHLKQFPSLCDASCL